MTFERLTNGVNRTAIINPNKCNYTVIGTKNNLKTLTPHNLDINILNFPISYSKVVTNLGLSSDDTLISNAHTTKACTKGLYIIRSLYQLRYYFNESTKLHRVLTLLLSHFDYCDAVYGPLLSVNNMRAIQSVQKAAVRFLYGFNKSEHVLYYLNNVYSFHRYIIAIRCAVLRYRNSYCSNSTVFDRSRIQLCNFKRTVLNLFFPFFLL